MNRFYKVKSNTTGIEFEFEGVEFFSIYPSDKYDISTLLELNVGETIKVEQFDIKVMTNEEVHFYFVKKMLAGSEKLSKMLDALRATYE